MGTDIHLIAEARDVDGVWQMVPGPIIDCWNCKGVGIVTRENHPHARADWLAEHLGGPCHSCAPATNYVDDDTEKGWHEEIDLDVNVEPGKIRDRWWSTRNYDVFAVLGNVRNGRGFAGVLTGDGFDPISDCRGFPDDISPAGLAWFKHNGGEHSATWVGLDEIMRYDFDQSATKYGVVDIDEYRAFRSEGAPPSWCGDVQGGSIQHVSNALMDELLSVSVDAGSGSWHPLIGGVSYVTRISWQQPYSRSLGEFIDRMKQLAITVGEYECRLVMDFDS